jgi:hypothetical protein
MITIKLPITINAELKNYIKQYNSVLRYSFNRFKDNLSLKDVKLKVKTLNNINLLDVSIIDEAIKNKITKIDILAFEFEMGLFPHIQEEAKSKGVDLTLKYIPKDVFDKRAIERIVSCIREKSNQQDIQKLQWFL